LALPAGAAHAATFAQPGWIDPGQVALSPDGRNVYATGFRTISFRRDTSTGALTEIDGFNPRASSIAITPDGQWVFLGDETPDGVRAGGAIHVLERDPASGRLTHTSSFTGGSGFQVGRVHDVEVSPDGRFLYVAQGSDDAVVTLAVDQATGALRVTQALYGGTGGEPGLGKPVDLALSPDGTNLYAAADRVAAFTRDPASGLLTSIPAGANQDQGGQAWHVVVSPDGGRVYAGVFNYAVYDRGPGGALTFRSKGYPAADDACGFACGWAGELVTSPDGSMVLNTRSVDDRLFQTAPTADGLRFVRSYANGEGGMQGLSDGDGLAWSADGRNLYVSGGEQVTPDYSSNTGIGGRVTTLRREGDALSFTSSTEPAFPLPGDIKGPPTVSIDRGAIYTNDPEVSVRVTLPYWLPSSFRLSNDGALEGSRLVKVSALAAEYRWRLDTSGGPQRTVKHVYVQFTEPGASYPDATLSDDVILDRLAPTLTMARLRGDRLLLRARDNRSGVRRVQVTRNRRRPGRAHRFRHRLRVSRPAAQLFVRVFDGAGNKSRWRRARR
jgi:DNA-binding beta-propeller fold protein YncE